MIRLGGGTDSFRGAGRMGGGGCAWPELAWRVEQGAAQVLQEAQAVSGHGEAAPAGRGPVQDRPDQGEAAGLAGEPAAPSEMISSGEGRPRSRRPARKSCHASKDSPVPGARAMKAGLPPVVMPQAASTGSAGEPGCIRKKLASRNR